MGIKIMNEMLHVTGDETLSSNMLQLRFRDVTHFLLTLQKEACKRKPQ